MAAAIERALPEFETQLKPGGRGDLIVTFDKKVLWNKRQQDDQFPDENDIVRRLETIVEDEAG